jgi:hypothetical protein
MALWLRRRPGNLESAAAKTSPSAAKTPQNFRIPRHSCRENGDSLENVLPCVLGLWRNKAQRSAIRVPRSGASLFYSTHGKYFASEGCLRSPSRSRMASVSSSTARFILSSSFGMGRRVRVSDAGLCAMGEIGHREPRPSGLARPALGILRRRVLGIRGQFFPSQTEPETRKTICLLEPAPAGLLLVTRSFAYLPS